MSFFRKIFPFFLLPVFVRAQVQLNQVDSMHVVLQHAANDTVRMDAYAYLGFFYDDVNLDSTVFYCEKGIAIAKRLKLKLYEAEMLINMSYSLTKMGNYPQSLKVLMQALEIAADPSNEKNTRNLLQWHTPHTYRISVLGATHIGFGTLYSYTNNYEKQIATYHEGKKLAESINDTVLLFFMYGDMGGAYNSLNKLDSALFYGQKAMEYFPVLPVSVRKYGGFVFSGIGSVYQRMGNLKLARENFERAIQVGEAHNNPSNSGDACLQLAKLYQSIMRPDSGLLYAKKALEAYKKVGKDMSKADAYRMISEFYWGQKNNDSSFAYLRLATLLNDSLEKEERKKIQEFRVMGFNEELRLQELEKLKIQAQNKIRIYLMLAGLGVFFTIGLILYRNNQQKQKANKILEETLTNLKSTQSQLIQSEKMASLGELTAGIAHEIQNPLNFVNNFSEVNKELLVELKEKMANKNLDEAQDIANDIIDNQEKITHHGKRADAIVKGMLQHSRTSSGEKEPTNINALTDEYLRLAYHGFRAKDKTFNVTTVTDYDETIGAVNIIPGDIGRVILNLITNAFYAVNEKQKAESEKPNFANGLYVPTVTLATKNLSNKPDSPWVEINIKDNGNGIPQNIVDKIFQPFFTTKPTGQGTGLGLSLSYDIVKAHGGELKVETIEHEGSKFIIQLPNG